MAFSCAARPCIVHNRLFRLINTQRAQCVPPNPWHLCCSSLQIKIREKSQFGKNSTKVSPSQVIVQQCDCRWLVILNVFLKVTKCDTFVTKFFILSYPVWLGDLRTEPKNPFVLSVRLLFTIFFYQWLSAVKLCPVYWVSRKNYSKPTECAV